MKKITPFRLEWLAPMHEHKIRSSDWLWAVGIITFSLALASVIFGNIILAIFILLSAFSLSLFINKEPAKIHVVIDEKGITKGRIHYSYKSLTSYWLDTDHPHPKIILQSSKYLMPLIIVPIGDEINAEELDRRLSRFLEEKYHSMPFIENVQEILGF